MFTKIRQGQKIFNRNARSILTLNRHQEFCTLSKLLELDNEDLLLDVGSGDGYWTRRLARKCQKVIGLEPDKALLRFACQVNREINLQYIRGVAEEIPFPNNTFSKIVSISCLEHFQDPFLGLCEMSRVLKPGGRLAVSVDSLLPENSNPRFYQWHKKRHLVTQYFHQEQLSEMMAKTGLRVQPRQTTHLFRSRYSALLRETFTRNPVPWLPLFPIFYLLVRFFDRFFDHHHGQIIILCAQRI